MNTLQKQMLEACIIILHENKKKHKVWPFFIFFFNSKYNTC